MTFRNRQGDVVVAADMRCSVVRLRAGYSVVDSKLVTCPTYPYLDAVSALGRNFKGARSRVTTVPRPIEAVQFSQNNISRAFT